MGQADPMRGKSAHALFETLEKRALLSATVHAAARIVHGSPQVVHASPKDVTSGVAGTYSGNITVDVGGKSTTSPGTVTIDKNGNVKFTAKINNIVKIPVSVKLVFGKSGNVIGGSTGSALGDNVMVQITGKKMDLSGTVDAVFADANISGTLTKQ